MTKFLISFRVFLTYNIKYFLYSSFNARYFYIRIYTISNSNKLNFNFFKRYIYLILQKLNTYLPEVDRIRQVTAPRPAFSVSTVMQYSSP